MGRAITFPKRVSRRLSVVVNARKARSRYLCDLEKVIFIPCVFKRGVFFSLLSYLSDCNMLLLVIELISLKRLTTRRRIF